MQGIAKINKNAIECDSDISFSCLADEKSIITMKPVQYISSVPKNASHSASIYKPTENQIYYLKMQHCIAMSVLGIEQRCLHRIFVCSRV